MAPWQLVARESTPEPLSADQANAIREAAILAGRAAAARPATRRAPMLIIGGALLGSVTAGIFVVQTPPPSAPEPARVASASPAMVRQLQFATPGGTRIIWQFDPNFSLRETLP